MNILNANLKFNSALSQRTRTDTIIVHHAEARSCTVEDIHRWHQGNGWAGIGYHYLVRKDGAVWRGRPEDTVGAHAGSKSGYNGRSIGICFEGDYMNETMPAAQLAAGQALIRDIQSRYGGRLTIKRHKDVCDTSCPGTRFPWVAMQDYNEQEDTDVYTIYKTIKDVPEWGRECVNDLLKKGILKGDGDGSLDLEHYMLRGFVVNWRAGLYK